MLFHEIMRSGSVNFCKYESILIKFSEIILQTLGWYSFDKW